MIDATFATAARLTLRERLCEETRMSAVEPAATPALARAALREATACLGRDDRRGAWRAVRRATAGAPDDPLVGVLAARLFWLLGDHTAALEASGRAVALGAPTALAVRADLAHAAGWYHEAAAMLDRQLAEAPEAAELTRLLERRVRLAVDHLDTDGAVAVLDRHLAHAESTPLFLLQAARVYRQAGDAAGAAAAVRRALAAPLPAAVAAQAAPVLIELGAFDEAAALQAGLVDDPVHGAAAREALARLCLWRGDVTGARAHAAHLPADGATAQRIAGALAMLGGDPGAALPLLDAALRADPRDGEAYCWRAEAQLRLGRRDEACRDADRSLQHGYSYAACAVRLLAVLPPPRGARALLRRWRERLRRHQRPDGGIQAARDELRAELTATAPAAARALAGERTDALAAAVEQSLAALRGNRTPTGTWVRPDGTLARVPASESPRILSRQALELIRIAPPEACFRALDALAARFPTSSMPVVHRGELNLWLGRYAAARADLEAAIAIRRETRWAWYGLTWLDILAGDPERALATCAEGIRVMHDTEGPVALICRGEAYRLLGRLDEAREQLRRSNAIFTTRLSAWVNLALVHGAAGDGSEQRTVMRHVLQAAPTLVSAAAAELGDDVLEHVVVARAWLAPGPPDPLLDRVLRHMLVMMRGNRASGLITWFTRDGILRHVPMARAHERDAAQAAAHMLARIERVLARAGA